MVKLHWPPLWRRKNADPHLANFAYKLSVFQPEGILPVVRSSVGGAVEWHDSCIPAVSQRRLSDSPICKNHLNRSLNPGLIYR